jgi:DNA polymerase-3 subunit epsilon
MSIIMYYDLETTGLQPLVNGIHQIAGIIEIDGKVKEEFNINMRPSEFHIIEQEALATSNLTLDDIMNNPYSQEEGFSEFVSILSRYVNPYVKAKDKDRLFRIGFNSASFDNNFLQQFFKNNNQDRSFFSFFYPDSPDVMVLCSDRFMDERRSFIDFKLPTLARRFGIEVDDSRLHEALYDVELTRRVYQKLKNIHPTGTFDELLRHYEEKSRMEENYPIKKDSCDSNFDLF